MRARWSMIVLVAGRELQDRLRRPSYYVIAGLFVLLILAFGVGTRLAGSSTPGPVDVAVTGSDAGAMAASLRATGKATDRTVHVHRSPTIRGALKTFDDGDADILVDTDRHRMITTDDVDATEAALARQAWTVTALEANLADAGLDATASAQVLQVQPLDVAARARPGSTDVSAVLTGTLAAALLFISLQIFGGQILSGVVEEKSTAVVEVLLARIRADELLAGKVLGIGIAAIAQFTVLVGAGLVALVIAGKDLPGAIWTAVPMTLVWYLTGFAFYAMLFALAGALVSRQEDAPGAAAPVTTALIGAYALLFVIAGSPDSPAARILSVIPPFAPILMPLRMASGSASIVEIVAALVLLALAIVAIWKFTARIYSQVLLRRGSRITWATVWAIARGADQA
ncbi:MAG TPA: ABC transporter permease [Acidimicrobiales bacterium]|nr:ABC transporter permease [Acidimicrobiales bacterium]